MSSHNGPNDKILGGEKIDSRKIKKCSLVAMRSRSTQLSSESTKFPGVIMKHVTSGIIYDLAAIQEPLIACVLVEIDIVVRDGKPVVS